jgi:4-hydroxybenzoate polyprenyltransferase
MADQVDSTSTETAVRFLQTKDERRPAGGERGSSKSLIQRFLELIRFSHTLFALPFAALASIMALALPFGEGSELSSSAIALRLVGVLVCMVTARAAAMAFNRLMDARWDAENPRTATRHLPSGELSSSQVWWFFALNCLAFSAACLLFLPNWLPIALSLPVLVLICGYSLAKRFTSAAHLWLGVALALSPICAWVAIRGEQVIADPSDLLPACVLGLAIALWVAGFDVIYACQDAEFDRRAGLHSLPARFGVKGALRISSLLHVAMLIVLACLPIFFARLSLGWIYWFALAGVSALVVRQHAIVRPGDLGRVNEAFFNINAIISFGLCSAAAVDACLR